jgi:hypothetical protein
LSHHPNLQSEGPARDLVDRPDLAGVDPVTVHEHRAAASVLNRRSSVLEVEIGVGLADGGIVQHHVAVCARAEHVLARHEHLRPHQQAVAQNDDLED